MMYRLVARPALWPLLTLLLLLGCAGNAQLLSSPAVESIQAPGSLRAGLPPLPVDAPSWRAPSETAFASVQGRDAVMVSEGTEISGTDLIITSADCELEYAIYRFETGLSETGTYETTVSLSLADGHEVWLALADYIDRRWVLSGPYTETIARPLDDGVFLSPWGDFYLAVLAWGGSEVTISAASFSFDNGVRPPGE